MAIQKISNAVIADNAIDSDNIANGAITVADIPDGEISTAKIADDAITNAKIAADSVTSTEIADDAVTDAKIDTVSSTKVTGRAQDNEDLPTIRPTLNLDFANSKELDPRITFTRSSTATYWDGKTTTKAEENLTTYSQDYTKTVAAGTGRWSIMDSLTTTGITAPDGTSTATQFTEGSLLDEYHGLKYNHNTSWLTNTEYSLSVYLKNGDRDYVTVVLHGNSNTYASVEANLSNGTISRTSASGFTLDTYTITAVGNSWYRVTLTSTTNTSVSQPWAYIAGSDGTTAIAGRGMVPYNGDGSSTFSVWGVQIEQRDNPTAYTPTTSSPIVKYQPTLQTASSGVARFDHDPVTGESKGLLIEEARTNLAASSSYSSAAVSNITKINNSCLAPTGYIATEFKPTTTSGLHRSSYAIALPNTNTITYSIYAKSNGVDYLALNDLDQAQRGAGFDLTGDGNVTNGSSGTGKIEKLNNGWFRCSVTFTPASTATTFNIEYRTSLGVFYESVAFNGFDGVFLTGFQVEQGHGASSYIPTSGSTVTRSPDDASIALTNEVSLQEATVYAEAATYRAYAAETAWCPIWQLNDGVSTANGVFDVRAFQKTYGSMAVANGFSGTTDLLNDSQTVTNGEFYKYGLFWNQGSVSFYKNGSLVNSATNQYANPVWDTLDIGWGDRGGRRLDGHIKKLAVYSQAFSNDTLIAMTEE